MTVIPTIFSRNKKEFQERFTRLLPIAKNIQIDFMDGKFVPTKSIALKDIPNLKKYTNNFEIHLMCLHPERYAKKLKKIGFKKIIFHIESTKDPEKVIHSIKSSDLIPFIALNPETPISNVINYLPMTKGVLLMGVHPGKEHQSFIPGVYKKISQLRKSNKKIPIQVDGGVNERVAKKLARLNVNNINSGSYISTSEKPREIYNKLIKEFRKG
jgi:ribulose-phosphate 3-epimerase